MIARLVVVAASVVLVAGVAREGRAQVKLEYKFTEGEARKSRSVVKTDQVLTIAGMDLKTNAEQVIVTGVAIGKRDGEGNLPIAHKIESFRSQAALPGGLSIAFDSANPDAKFDNPDLAFLADVFKGVGGLSYTVVLDAKDQLKGVEKVESSLVKLDDVDPKAKGFLKDILDGEKLRHEFRQGHGNLPAILVREGEPWDITEVTDLGAGQTLTCKNRYEYRGTVELDCCTLDKIDVKTREVTYEMAPDSPSPLKLARSDLKVDSSEGTILFDRKLGRTVERKAVTRIKGDLTFKVGDKELPGQLDLTIDTATTLEP